MECGGRGAFLITAAFCFNDETAPRVIMKFNLKTWCCRVIFALWSNHPIGSLMNSKEIILANIHHTGPDRPGLTFDRGRRNDMLTLWLRPDLQKLSRPVRHWRPGGMG